MTLARDVELPLPASAGSGLLDLTRPLPAGWERGVVFATGVCLTSGIHQFCAGSPTEKSFQATDLGEFTPFGVEVSVVCTTLDSEERRVSQARAALGLVAEASVGAEFATGATSGNPSLADATPSGAGATAAQALGVLEDVIAGALSGQQATVHMAPSDLVALAAASAVQQDLAGWVTPGGHRIIASAGYVTLAGTLFATAEVFAGLGTPFEIRTVDRTDNRHLVVHEAPALAIFDPCFNVSVDITDSPASP